MVNIGISGPINVLHSNFPHVSLYKNPRHFTLVLAPFLAHHSKIAANIKVIITAALNMICKMINSTNIFIGVK
jgi:hypothetical protein